MSRLDVLNEAFDEMEAAPDAEEEAAEVAAPVEVELAPEPEVAEEAPKDERTAAERARDDQGRFAKAEKEAAKKAAAPLKAEKMAPAAPGKAAVAAPVAPAQPVAPAVKPPQSWTPAARDAFAKAPPEVQKEVERRERDIARTLQETAEARRTYDAVRSTLGPIEPIARANGMDAMSFAGGAVQAYAAIYSGAPQQAVSVVAGAVQMLTQRFGPQALEMINAAMAGQPGPQAQTQHQPPDVSRMVEQALEQKFRAAEEHKASSDWQQFVNAAPEFLDDVKGDMQEILELAGRQGRNMTYQQAYDRACKLNEDVSSTLGQRKAAEDARTKQQAIARARGAKVSIKSQPTAAVAAQPAGRRAVLEAAFDAERES